MLLHSSPRRAGYNNARKDIILVLAVLFGYLAAFWQDYLIPVLRFCTTKITSAVKNIPRREITFRAEISEISSFARNLRIPYISA